MSARRNLTVRVVLTVTVDREAYDNEYGVHATADDIREDVRGVAVTALRSQWQHITDEYGAPAVIVGEVTR